MEMKRNTYFLPQQEKENVVMAKKLILHLVKNLQKQYT